MNPEDTTAITRLVTVLVRYRFMLLPAGLLLLAAAWPVAQRLEFDQSIESLYAGNDPHLTDYQESKRLFGGDEFAVVAYADPELLDPATGVVTEAAAKRIHDLSNRLNKIDGINPASTQDLAALTVRTGEVVDNTANRFVEQAKGKGVAERGKAFVKALALRKFQSQAVHRVYTQVHGILIGEDNTTSIVLRLLPHETSPVPRGDTIAEIRRIAAEFGEEHGLQVAVVGEPVQVHDMFRYVEEDGAKLFYWSLFALSVVIFLLFRSLRWVILPVLVVWSTIVWTDALLVLSGMKLSMVSSMMNSLVTIIGIATVTHITVHYRNLRRTLERSEAVRKTLATLLPAIFWTCATTAIGFGALISSSITPVRSFGLMLALASFVVLITVCVFLPGGMLLGQFDADPRSTPAEKHLAGFLTRSATGVQRHPLLVSLIMATVFGFAAYGLVLMTVETDFSKNFRKSSPIVRSLVFVETKLGGAGTWEVNFPAPKSLSEEYLEKIRNLAERLRTEFVRNGKGDVTKVVAITDGLDAIPSVVVPELDERMEMVGQLQHEFIPGLYNPEAGRMRIVLRAREQQQSAEKLRLIDDVKKATAEFWAERALTEEEIEESDVNATGLYVLLAFLIDNLLRDQLLSFLIAATGVVIMISVAFRSLPIGLLMLLPNTFPIVLVIGGIGWLGLPINIATAMIASVSMGLTIDFNIHYLYGYRRARLRGLSEEAALQETLQSVGRALVFSNLALIVGFSVLTVSHFIPLVYFGILVSFAMLGGLISDFVLMPLILIWTGWPKIPTTTTDASNAE